jgi:hypothetical protein
MKSIPSDIPLHNWPPAWPKARGGWRVAKAGHWYKRTSNQRGTLTLKVAELEAVARMAVNDRWMTHAEICSALGVGSLRTEKARLALWLLSETGWVRLERLTVTTTRLEVDIGDQVGEHWRHVRGRS